MPAAFRGGSVGWTVTNDRLQMGDVFTEHTGTRMPQERKRPEVTRTRIADENNAVLTIKGGNGAYRKEPCAECPWRKEHAGSFPAEAFRHSAPTAYDMARETFACHMSGKHAPTTCAGFILASDHNMNLRMAEIDGRLDYSKISDGGADLFESYREMAIANGVDPDDPTIAPCR